MKKILFIVLLYMSIAPFSIAQKKTTINLKFENFKDTVIRISIPIVDSKFGQKSTKEYVSEKKNGNFHFNFPLEESASISIYSNLVGGLIFIPGTFTIFINPGDSLNFTLRDNILGLTNMEITGRGAEKLLMVKEVAKKMNSSHLYTKPYRKQNITERYLEMDRALDVIDSMFNINPNKDSRDFKIVKAQLVDQTLNNIMSQSVPRYNDSVAELFNKFIKNKKRIAPLLDSSAFEYYGGSSTLPYFVYLSNMHQLGDRYDYFLHDYPLEYASLVKKEFENFSNVKDYLLSDHAIITFREKWFGKISTDIYKFYLANVNKRSPYYQYVLNEYKQLKDVFMAGKPFYNYNLPDTTGNYHSLKDLRGKVVVLDFWFTGCGACKTLVPALSKIEDSLKNEKIQFVSISVDNTVDVWKRGIGIYSVKKSLQLYTEGKRYDHPIIKFGKVNAFPTLIVLDREGKIVGIPPHPLKDPQGFKNYLKKCLQ